MDINELANEAIKRKINLGTNPVRTIRYYINIGTLQRPEIIQSGKRRSSEYNIDHLVRLNFINYYKNKGLSLQEIKNKVDEKLFWSDFSLNIIEEYRDEIPPDAFKKDKPATRAELAFFLSKKLLSEKESLSLEELKKVLIDKDGNYADIPFE